MAKYNPQKIEKKWQLNWDKKKIYQAKDNSKAFASAKASADKDKFYVLVEFPYPSGDGLHVGHVRSYTALDAVSRYKRMKGFNVLYPMGWDAFGLPAENYAIKTGIHPSITTKKNIATFKKQMKSLGLSFDWSREVNTTDPEYYKWTQWIFLQLFKKGLAYKKRMDVNWCPKDKTVLANEEVVDGKCERCGTPVERKEKEQWMMAITKYADRLIEDLDTVNYLDKIKTQQINWIGKSFGTQIDFKIENSSQKITVFTTRIDTIFGVTAVVLAPENLLVSGLIKKEKEKEVFDYIKNSKSKSEFERTKLEKNKTGVFTGSYCINPINDEKVPIWIGDYVIATYAGGAVMMVPAHDERDYDFAQKYNLPIKQVVAPFFTAKPGSKDSIREDKKTVKRKTAYALVSDKKTNKFLCLDWEKFGWHSGVIGGTEKEEDYKEAAIREIKEETGYKNLKFIKELGGEQHNSFFAAHKDENRYAFGQGVLFELINDEKDSVESEHSKNHKPVWIEADKMERWLNLDSFVYMWQAYKSGSDCFTSDGVLINSGEFNDLNSAEARDKISQALFGKEVGKKVVQYKLRDWVFSRQHYWGEPIPIIHCPVCGIVPVPEKDLPVKLPFVKKYQPTETGESPLSEIASFVKVKCPVCKGLAKRETDTMPNWAGSSWYYIRYADPKNKKALASENLLKQWLPVDWYNGGMEHTTLHLLYSRFWHKFLYDIKVVPQSEPYAKRTSHGMVLAQDGQKMSKSRGNVINPDSVIKEFGADTLRLYEMFMGPFDQMISWDTNGMVGVRRFLDRLWNFCLVKKWPEKSSKEVDSALHKLIKKVGEDLEAAKFNTAIAAFMEFLNLINSKPEAVDKETIKATLILFAPFAPHISEEIWAALGNKKSIHLQDWPKYNPELIKDDQAIVVVQINGKVREKLEIMANMPDEEVKKLALSTERIKSLLNSQEPKKVIYIKGKLINIVI